MDSALRPRDIQTRIRGGETPEAVAQAAQAPIEKIMVFAAPVLAERAHVAQRAQASSLRRKAGDTGARTLGEAVSAHLHGFNVDPAVVEWDAWRREDGRWTLTGAFRTTAAQGQGDLRLRRARQLRHLRGRGRALAGRRGRRPPCRGRRSHALRRPPAGPRAPAGRRTRRRAAAGRGRHRAGQRRRRHRRGRARPRPRWRSATAGLRRRQDAPRGRPRPPAVEDPSTTRPRTSRSRGDPPARPAAAPRCRAGTRSCSAARTSDGPDALDRPEHPSRQEHGDPAGAARPR